MAEEICDHAPSVLLLDDDFLLGKKDVRLTFRENLMNLKQILEYGTFRGDCLILSSSCGTELHEVILNF